jgi:hypothetical protein
MPRWDIDPEGVRRVVTRTAGVAEGLIDPVEAYSKHLQSAIEACGSPIVAQALFDFAAVKQSLLKDVISRTDAVMTAAAEATKAYVEGDLDMAQAAQANGTIFARSSSSLR